MTDTARLRSLLFRSRVAGRYSELVAGAFRRGELTEDEARGRLSVAWLRLFGAERCS